MIDQKQIRTRAGGKPALHPYHPPEQKDHVVNRAHSHVDHHFKSENHQLRDGHLHTKTGPAAKSGKRKKSLGTAALFLVAIPILIFVVILSI